VHKNWGSSKKSLIKCNKGRWSQSGIRSEKGEKSRVRRVTEKRGIQTHALFTGRDATTTGVGKKRGLTSISGKSIRL